MVTQGCMSQFHLVTPVVHLLVWTTNRKKCRFYFSNKRTNLSCLQCSGIHLHLGDCFSCNHYSLRHWRARITVTILECINGDGNRFERKDTSTSHEIDGKSGLWRWRLHLVLKRFNLVVYPFYVTRVSVLYAVLEVSIARHVNNAVQRQPFVKSLLFCGKLGHRSQPKDEKLTRKSEEEKSNMIVSICRAEWFVVSPCAWLILL